MTLIELKESLHKKIEEASDEHVLEQVAAVLDNNKDEIPIISKHIREGIEQGRRDIENGDFITLEELEKKYQKWLKE